METNSLRSNIVDFSERKTSMVEQQLELIREINSIIKKSPLGENLQLTIISKELQLESDEIFVQEVDIENRKITLTPKNIKELSMDDLIHETQVIKLKDKASSDFLENVVAAKCLKRNDLYGNKVHIYD